MATLRSLVQNKMAATAMIVIFPLFRTIVHGVDQAASQDAFQEKEKATVR